MLDLGEQHGQRETNTKEGVGEDGHGEGQCNECLILVNGWKTQEEQ